MILTGAWAPPATVPPATLPPDAVGASGTGGRPPLTAGPQPRPVVVLLEIEVRGVE